MVSFASSLFLVLTHVGLVLRLGRSCRSRCRGTDIDSTHHYSNDVGGLAAAASGRTLVCHGGHCNDNDDEENADNDNEGLKVIHGKDDEEG